MNPLSKILIYTLFLLYTIIGQAQVNIEGEWKLIDTIGYQSIEPLEGTTVNEEFVKRSSNCELPVGMSILEFKNKEVFSQGKNYGKYVLVEEKIPSTQLISVYIKMKSCDYGINLSENTLMIIFPIKDNDSISLKYQKLN